MKRKDKKKRREVWGGVLTWFPSASLCDPTGGEREREREREIGPDTSIFA